MRELVHGRDRMPVVLIRHRMDLVPDFAHAIATYPYFNVDHAIRENPSAREQEPLRGAVVAAAKHEQTGICRAHAAAVDVVHRAGQSPLRSREERHRCHRYETPPSAFLRQRAVLNRALHINIAFP